MSTNTQFEIVQLRDGEGWERIEDSWPVLYSDAEAAKADFAPARMFEHTDDEDRPSYFIREICHGISTGIEIPLVSP